VALATSIAAWAAEENEENEETLFFGIYKELVSSDTSHCTRD